MKAGELTFLGLLLSFPPIHPTSWRDCPKSPRGACSVALRAAQKPVSIYFERHIRTKSAVGALLAPLFGQSRKRNSPKFRIDKTLIIPARIMVPPGVGPPDRGYGADRTSPLRRSTKVDETTRHPHGRVYVLVCDG